MEKKTLKCLEKRASHVENFDKKTVQRLQELCRIRCSDEETETFYKNIERILDYMKILEEVDVEGVEPCYQVLEDLYLPLREDEVGETLPRETLLKNSPEQTAGMIRVPPIIQEDN